MDITVDPSLQVSTKPLQSRSPAAYGSEVVKHLGSDPNATVEYTSQCAELVDCGYDREFGMETHNSFVETVHTSFAHHYPLRLSPNALWLVILQSLALHVHLYADELRHKFVNFLGKQTIVVRNDSLVRGGKSDWTPVLGQFSGELRKHLEQGVVDNLLCDFSTTDSVARAASEVALMDVMSSYFNYECITECGIPRITLEGTLADWKRLYEKALTLRQYGLSWWIDELQPILEKLVLAAGGEVDRDFWQSFYKIQQMSGGPFINGWILAFFPYLVSSGDKPTRNDMMGLWRQGPQPFMGVTSEDLPCGLSSVPFIWRYYGTEIKMKFMSGFFGVEQDSTTLALKPHIGFAVVDVSNMI